MTLALIFFFLGQRMVRSCLLPSSLPCCRLRLVSGGVRSMQVAGPRDLDTSEEVAMASGTTGGSDRNRDGA